jgi:O-6-methylguanine DNA methyltransferase
MMDVRTWTTPLAVFDVEVTDHGVSRLDLHEAHEARELPELDNDTSTRMLDYFNGTPNTVSIDLSAVTSTIQQFTLAKLLEIPYGEVRPYAWVAKEIGQPRAVRAVASAVARNPVPVLVPCHRVVRTDGHIGNFSLGGAEVKRQLLQHEGVDIDRLERLAHRNVRFIADKETNIFHLPTCHSGPHIDSSMLLEVKSQIEASNTKLDPCTKCRPV